MSQTHKKLEKLLLFAEVAKQLSYTKAAETLGISKGYLSAQIKQLESELATPLLVRSTRRVKLTAAGEEITAYTDEIKRSLLSVERFVRDDYQRVGGEIRITAPKQFAQAVLAPLCHEFVLLHPDISFAIDSSYTRYDLSSDDFDIAFRATKHPPDNMIAKKVLSYHYQCCASAGYIAEHGMPNHPVALVKHQCITALPDSDWQFSSGNVAIRGWLTSNDNAMIKEQAIAGRGIIRLPDYYVLQAIKQGLLQPVLSDFNVMGQDIYLLQPQLIYPPRKVALFVKFAEAYLANME